MDGADEVVGADQVRRAYGALATRYVELFGSTDQVHADDLDLITRHLAIHPGAVLDVGCGPGHLTAHLRSLGVDAIGLDLVPAFLTHARTTDPDGSYGLASMHQLPVADRSLAGVLAWYSLIHLPPDQLDDVLAELRRVVVTGGTLVVGTFDGDELAPFPHQVLTAHTWPVDQLAARLARAGFTEVERQRRPGLPEPGKRPHAALVTIAR